MRAIHIEKLLKPLKIFRFSKVPNEPTCSDSDVSESEENLTDNEESSDELEGYDKTSKSRPEEGFIDFLIICILTISAQLKFELNSEVTFFFRATTLDCTFYSR